MKMISIRHFVAVPLLACLAINLPVAAQDRFLPPDAGNIGLEGYAGEKIRACIDNGILQTSTSMLVAKLLSER